MTETAPDFRVTNESRASGPMFQNVGGQMIDVRVFPIPIRDDCVVRVFGIPHDLTRAEAERIGRVIMALAAPKDCTPTPSHKGGNRNGG